MTKPNRKRANTARALETNVPFLLSIVIGISILGVWLFHTSGIPEYYRMKQEETQLHRDILELKEGNTRLREEIARVQSDPATLEALAREQLGFVREGDVVYQLVKPQ